MLIYESVTQPKGQSNRDLISKVLRAGEINYIDVAVAYVTTGGARDLLNTLEESLGVQWPTSQKRWLIAFDYCRTEPVAAKMLLNAPQSAVRVHDGARIVLQKGCIPRIPFHPKTFLFRGPGRHAVFAGSGNISRSGLNTGHEVGLLMDCHPPKAKRDAALLSQVKAIQAWYEMSWNAAPRLTSALLTSYQEVFESAPNLRHPTPTDDDHARPDERPSTLTADDLRKLRACRHLWIEAGNVTKNLGHFRPGNQLMMKRLTRVFFGVPATNVPQNSPLTRIKIYYNGVPKDDCSLTFSDNGMDKLTLPIPDAGGPTAYDGETLLFTRQAAGVFQLDLGTAAQKRAWLNKSTAIAANHTMPAQGRQWGVF